MLKFSKISPDRLYSYLLRISCKHNIRFPRNVFPQRDAYLSMHLSSASPAFSCAIRSRHSYTEKSTKRYIYSRIVKMRTSPALEWIHREKREETKPRKSLAWTAANHPLCFDSILPSCTFRPRRWDRTVPSSPRENCRPFKFIYFSPFQYLLFSSISLISTLNCNPLNSGNRLHNQDLWDHFQQSLSPLRYYFSFFFGERTCYTY